MPTIYQLCGEEVTDLAEEITKAYHQDLHQAGVQVRYLYAFKVDKAEQPNGHALKHHGYPALAIIKINSLKDRVAGLADATCLIEGDAWNERGEAQRKAILDHELEHLTLVVDDAGAVEKDDAGRPKLKMRLHDYQLGGFESVLERHRAASAESSLLQDLFARPTVQGMFKW